MKSPRCALTSLRRLPVAAAAAALALAGCAGAGAATRPAPSPGPHQITILFKADPAGHRDCPVSVTVEAARQCVEGGARKPDCLDTGKAATVVFLAEESDAPAGSGELEFSLDFDPFKKGGNPFHGRKGQALVLRLDPDSPAKAYTYNVFSGTCPVLDPQIIIR